MCGNVVSVPHCNSPAHPHFLLSSSASTAEPSQTTRREEDSERNTICGTPNYMAPEVQGAAYGLSADLWSAGCLFYAMVTGGAPFQGRRVGDTLANARAGRYVVPEGLSDAAKDFLACMLSKVSCCSRVSEEEEKEDEKN